MAETKAASLQDVKLSQEGESVVASDFPVQTDFTAKTKSTSGRVIFKLLGQIRRSVYVDGICDVINPKTKHKERMRLLRGVPEIWLKEQKDVPKEYVDKNRISLHFRNMACILDEVADATSIEFARLHNGFLGNEKRLKGAKIEFYEWNPAQQEKEALELEMLQNEVVGIAMTLPYEKVKKHANFLGGISFVDEMGEPRTEDGVRTLYIRRAKADPKRFKATLDSKEVEISYLIKRAILDTKIESAKGRIAWASGGLICSIPVGKDITTHLLELALLPTDEGKQFLERLQQV